VVTVTVVAAVALTVAPFPVPDALAASVVVAESVVVQL
jgi:hypothetical protein